MKTIKFGFLTALIILLSTSCVESSKKYKALVSERDSIQMNMKAVQESYNQTIDLLGAVDSGFAAISETEKSLKIEMNGIEGNSAARKQEMAARFEQLKTVLAENKSKVGKLQALLAASGNKNAKLAETIKRLEAELVEKTASLTTLQEQLTKKDIQISELNTSVNTLNSNVKSLNEETTKQKNTLKEQDIALNTVHYTVAASKSLKDAGIVASNGLFQPKSVLASNFNKSVFTSVDRRELNSIPTAAKKVKILSSHPADSYSLDVKEDKMVTINIKNADKFWSVSKYLVVQK
jgi:uncharacterized phage infection (PIP) family protein YhgE